MLTAAKETSPVSIPTASGYTGFFLFSCLPSFAAKRKNPAIQAPHLWLKRPPVQKPLIGDFGDELYHIKKEFDEEGEDFANGVAGIGLFYFGARYYDPEIGLWTSTDSAEQFWSLYAYGSNPINSIDPDGEAQVKTVPQPIMGQAGFMREIGTNRIAHRAPVYSLSVRSMDEFIASYVSIGVPEVGIAYGLMKFIDTGDPKVFFDLAVSKGMGQMPKALGNANTIVGMMNSIKGDLDAKGLWDSQHAIAAFQAEFRTSWWQFWKPKPEFSSAQAAINAWNNAMTKHGIEGAWIEDVGGPATVDGGGLIEK